MKERRLSKRNDSDEVAKLGEPNEHSELPELVDRPILATPDVTDLPTTMVPFKDPTTVSEDEYNPLLDSEKPVGSMVKAEQTALLIAEVDSEFDSDLHVAHTTLEILFKDLINQKILLMSEQQVGPFLSLLEKTDIKVAVAQTTSKPSALFSFNVRGVQVVTDDGLPTSNTRTDETGVPNVKALGTQDIDGLANVTQKDVDEALTKIRKVGAVTSASWNKPLQGADHDQDTAEVSEDM